MPGYERELYNVQFSLHIILLLCIYSLINFNYGLRLLFIIFILYNVLYICVYFTTGRPLVL